jgi:hypothetical protein
MDSLMSLENDSLIEDLLPSGNAFLVRQSRYVNLFVLQSSQIFQLFISDL